MLDWKRYLKISDGVLDEELIRKLAKANRVSEHFRENMAKPIQERKEKWAMQGFLGIVRTIMKNQPSQYPNAEEGLNLNEARGWQRKVMQMQAFIGYSYYVGGADTPKDRQSFRWYLSRARHEGPAQVAFMYAYG